MDGKNEVWWVKGLAGGFAAMTAETATIPVELTKVRMQMVRSAGGTADGHGQSMAAEIVSVLRKEGVSALFRGLGAALARQLVTQSSKMLCYEPLREATVRAMGGDDQDVASPHLHHMIVAGGIAGISGVILGNPFDLIKARLQASGPDASLQSFKYNSLSHAVRAIVRAEGVGALWKGLIPNAQRSFFCNAAELSAYDATKRWLAGFLGLEEGLFMHTLASLSAGLAAAIATTPIDLAKTRIMNQTSENPQYRGMLDCFRQVVTQEGPLGLYKGFLPCWMRIGPWTWLFFVSFEQYRRLGNYCAGSANNILS